MTLDYQGLTQQIRTVGEQALQAYQRLQVRKQLAHTLFEKHAQQVYVLRQKVEQAATLVPSLRCALPLEEPLDAHFSVSTTSQPHLVLAADGSQIFPDRHAQVNYYLINVGTILWQGGGEMPQINTQTHLFFNEEYFSSDLSSSEMISLRRDLMEREVLAKRVQEAKAVPHYASLPIITLTDGTLGLWGIPDQEEESSHGVYRQALQDYLKVLTSLRDVQAITAAYVDKPRVDWLVRLLEIAELDDMRLKKAARLELLTGVTDEDLLGERLAPGERSAVFGIQAQFANAYRDELALHFFYLNVGNLASPWLVRVEIPAWVAFSASQIELLQAVLLEQCQLMGAHPYPYLLHRAHEAAVVTQAEKEQVDLMLIRELNRCGLPVGFESQKQFHKNSNKRRI